MYEYHGLVDLKQWEYSGSKERSQDQPFLLEAYTLVIEQSFNKALKQVKFKICHNKKCNGSGGGSSARLDVKCQKCEKKVHIKRIADPIEIVLVAVRPRIQQERFYGNQFVLL